MEHLGHEVHAYSNGNAAWAAYEKEPVRAIVSDWLMPRLDGLEFCRRVRAREDLGYTYSFC